MLRLGIEIANRKSRVLLLDGVRMDPLAAFSSAGCCSCCFGRLVSDCSRYSTSLQHNYVVEGFSAAWEGEHAVLTKAMSTLKQTQLDKLKERFGEGICNEHRAAIPESSLADGHSALLLRCYGTISY